MRIASPRIAASAKRIARPLLPWILLLPGVAMALGIGKPAPELKATLLDGSPYALSEHRGDVVIINFWATWCEPCMAELPAFKAFLAVHPDAHVNLLAVSVDDPDRRPKVEQLAKSLGIPVAMVDDVDAGGYGRIWRLPMTFVVDRAGLLRVDGGVGEQKPYDAPLLDRVVAPLLAEPAGPPQKE